MVRRGEGSYRTSSPSKFLGIVLILAAVATCPSHDSFLAHLRSSSDHPDGLTSGISSGISAFAAHVHTAYAADSESWFAFRVGRYQQDNFIGLFGSWMLGPRLPKLPSLPETPMELRLDLLVCNGSAGFDPHELFALLCILGFVLWQYFPYLMLKNAVCSWDNMSRGRIWVVLTANISHQVLLLLIHNVMQVLQFGPVLQAALGCERLLTLLGCASIASSATSLAWALAHGPQRHIPDNFGASGVVFAFQGANAALFRTTLLRVYGFEMRPEQWLALSLILECAWQQRRIDYRRPRVWFAYRFFEPIDVSAQVGGTLCGWLLVQHWQASLPFWRI